MSQGCAGHGPSFRSPIAESGLRLPITDFRVGDGRQFQAVHIHLRSSIFHLKSPPAYATSLSPGYARRDIQRRSVAETTSRPARSASPWRGRGRLSVQLPDILVLGCSTTSCAFVRRRGGESQRSEERRVGKECRSRWSP